MSRYVVELLDHVFGLLSTCIAASFLKHDRTGQNRTPRDETRRYDTIPTETSERMTSDEEGRGESRRDDDTRQDKIVLIRPFVA